MPQDSSIQTPLAKARGLGSAHHGSHHWMMQRVTALANIPLVFWLVYSIMALMGADYMTFTTWLSDPVNAVLMILFIINSFYHAALGLQIIIEDYIAHKPFRLLKLIGMRLFFFAMAVIAIFSVLSIVFGG